MYSLLLGQQTGPHDMATGGRKGDFIWDTGMQCVRGGETQTKGGWLPVQGRVIMSGQDKDTKTLCTSLNRKDSSEK